MSFKYETIILTDQEGTIDVPLKTAASLFQVTIVTKSIGIEEDLTTNPPTLASPPVDITEGVWTFDAQPYLAARLPSDFEPVYTTSAGSTIMSVDASLEHRTFHIAYFQLNTLRIKPSVEITDPWSVVIKQGTV